MDNSNLPLQTQAINQSELADSVAINSNNIALSAKSAKHLSMWDLFIGADFIIQLVMLGLFIASVWSWAIILHKFIKLKKLNQLANQFEEAFWSGGSLDDLFAKLQNKYIDPMSATFCAAMREWKRSVTKAKSLNFKSTEQRIERVMQVCLNREVELLEKNMGFLASLGSNAVIVGLFGTVLGIMNSFESIAAMQNTNLAVVAPGIAEALFATAIGLIAAIPAAIAYNTLYSDINRYASRLETFTSEFGAIISRQLEE